MEDWFGQVKTDTRLSNFSQDKISFKTIWVFVTQERMETMTAILPKDNHRREN
jgi:hypothetical protein